MTDWTTPPATAARFFEGVARIAVGGGVGIAIALVVTVTVGWQALAAIGLLTVIHIPLSKALPADGGVV